MQINNNDHYVKVASCARFVDAGQRAAAAALGCRRASLPARWNTLLRPPPRPPGVVLYPLWVPLFGLTLCVGLLAGQLDHGNDSCENLT